MAQPLLFSLIDKAIYDYSMIVPGDRILLGASGGKDSTALIEYFAQRSKRRSADFEFKCIHIHSEITPPLNEELSSMFRQWDVDVESIYVDVLNRVKPGRKMNCYWCSTQRRTELLKYAMDNGYNKIALGHHLDDLLHTAMLNLTFNGSFSTMPVKLALRKMPLTLIRPLAFIPEADLRRWAELRGYRKVDKVCPFDRASNRTSVGSAMQAIGQLNPDYRSHLLQALRRAGALEETPGDEARCL